ncbi:nucleotidyltransferase family protein [candidate division CSSED10-310 bacterium]|uniref:Nucleotidyltransferase family protein n=1 Tax=candidate division CSSED10-310 bacterium TaxID=2855610 RepID=A0ABV6YUH3_UNCC1
MRPFPTEQQELLLQAAFLQGDLALQAWRAWLSQTDLDSIDRESFQLLPQLYRNLSHLSPDGDELPKLKGIYRHAWAQNQVSLHQIIPLLQTLQENRIDFLLLNGAAMILLHLSDYGHRLLSNISIFVRVNQVRAAFRVLRNNDWQPASPLSAESLRQVTPARGSIGFSNRENQAKLTLYWHLYPDIQHLQSNSQLLHYAIREKLHHVPLKVINPTDHLMYLCVSGFKYKRLAPLHWITDAIIVTNRASTIIDWERLIIQAMGCRFFLPLQETLLYLSENYHVLIPPEILKSMERLATLVSDYKSRAGKSQISVLTAGRFIWFLNSHLAEQTSWLRMMIRFPQFLQHYWGLIYPGQIPFTILKKVLQTIRYGWSCEHPQN